MRKLRFEEGDTKEHIDFKEKQFLEKRGWRLYSKSRYTRFWEKQGAHYPQAQALDLELKYKPESSIIELSEEEAKT